MSSGWAMMSTEPSRAEAIRRSSPVGPDAAAVALEVALAFREDPLELLNRFVLVLAVGEKDGVAQIGRRALEEPARKRQPCADRGAA
jgi:hypothetical protein